MTTPELTLAYNVPHRPRATGAGPLSLVASGIALVGAIVTVILVTFVSVPAGAVFFLFGGVFLAFITIKDRHNRSYLDRSCARLGHRRKVKTGADRLHGGSLTRLGTHHLPGVLASSFLTEGEDSHRHPYALLTYPQTGHHVVVIKANPYGTALSDVATNDERVAKFADWLAGLAHEQGLRQAAITVEIAADSAPALQREIAENMDPDAPEIAQTVLRQILQRYPEDGTSSRTYVTLTFNTPAGRNRKERKDGGAAVMHRRLESRLPQILAELPATGAGSVSLMTAADLIETVRCAYNPGDRELYQQLRARGEDPPVMLWNSAGPTATKEGWGTYRHSSDATSVTWEKTGFTSSQVTDRCMAPLLQPNPDTDVLRTTWVYQPVSPAVSAVIAENDHRSADNRVINMKKPSARAVRDRDRADRTRVAEAHGAALLNFAILVTATVRDPKPVANAVAAVDHAGPAARLLLRSMDGSQAAAFAQGVGVLGLVTDAHLTIPTSVRTGL